MEEANNHSHVGDELQNQTSIVLCEIREGASTSRACTRNVISRELVEANNDVLARMPRKSAIEKRIQRVRKKAEVGIVLNPQDRYFQIPELYAGIVLYDSDAEDASRIIAIGNDGLMGVLETAPLWFGDGTFDVAPLCFFPIIHYSL